MQYTNPILYGDYSDPDVIRVGEDFYMISSSFTYLPGIPVLRSRDLVHWALIGYAAEALPFPRYARPAHGKGAWAPSIRWHNGLFYVYVCLPDEGLLCFTAADPAGKWQCHYVKDVVGWIDPCPLFDADGRVYLVHGLAASRAGINNMLFVHAMSGDGLQVMDKGRMVYDGADHGDITVEGPKFYRRRGEYWILCPAGGVKTGYQLALRARGPLGPYERRVVLSQGASPVNGPHQGGWVEDGRGGDWFIHFQDVGPYGRVPHLQRVDWADGWPMMGDRGTPVMAGDTLLPPYDGQIPASDVFLDGPGLQWQWQANPDPKWSAALRPGLRLYSYPAESVYEAGHFLSQLMQHRNFDFDVRLRLHPQAGDRAGVALMGRVWYELSLDGQQSTLLRGEAEEGDRWSKDQVRQEILCQMEYPRDEALLRLRIREGRAGFFIGEDEASLRPVGETYPMLPGGWTGARPGIFARNTRGHGGGYADFAFVRVRPALEDKEE